MSTVAKVHFHEMFCFSYFIFTKCAKFDSSSSLHIHRKLKNSSVLRIFCLNYAKDRFFEEIDIVMLPRLSHIREARNFSYFFEHIQAYG
jgi:hypothetical protein